MRSKYDLNAHQDSTHYYRCSLCGKAWYDSVIRKCPEREERRVCMYCCKLCGRSARSGSGQDCRAMDRARAEEKQKKRDDASRER